MPEIQLDIDQLLSDVIQQTNDTLGKIDETMQMACNTVGTLTIIGWDGKARDEYIELFSSFKKRMRLFYENLNALNDCLKNIYTEGEGVYQKGSSLSEEL